MESSSVASTGHVRKTSTKPVEEADLHASSEEYADRFSGPTGRWMLAIQEAALESMLTPDITTVLDVGGGHGQIAIPLAQRQKSVTVLGSSPACAQRLEPLIETGAISFVSGNLVELPFRPRSFDAVVSFRLMSHCVAWRSLVAEMCRVADTMVIFDYPLWCSFNFLTPLLFSLKRRIEGNTRTYRIFTTHELIKEFQAHGFAMTRIQKQFFLPMGIHRGIKNPGLSKTIELIAHWALLTRLFGSPGIVRFERIS